MRLAWRGSTWIIEVGLGRATTSVVSVDQELERSAMYC